MADRLRQLLRRIAVLPRQLLIVLVRVYRLLLSPWLGNSCRFAPTCSVYAIQALQRHGAVVGTGLATWRVLRCHPWCTPGDDPVPERPLRLFTDLLSSSNSEKPSP